MVIGEITKPPTVKEQAIEEFSLGTNPSEVRSWKESNTGQR
jgi:hypothetical protein